VLNIVYYDTTTSAIDKCQWQYLLLREV